ncbi:MAG: DUF11 domain-containing protein [Alphaproteobacteria bacterium]|nr:DUF11 domain-containing protein [Alphaproteobacteria bacterium]
MNHKSPTSQQKKPGAARLVTAHSAALLLAVGLNISAARATIDNTAIATGTYAAAPVTSNPSTVSVSVVASAPHMLVTKSANPTTNLRAGETVTYTYTVKNDGNVTLRNISLADVHNAAGPAPSPSLEVLSIDAPPVGDSSDVTPSDGVWNVLAPGDTVTFKATYIVQQTDVDQRQ